MWKVLLTYVCFPLFLIFVPMFTGCVSPGSIPLHDGLPQAQFNANGNIKDGQAPLNVDFVNNSQNADEFRWDFGDSATATTFRVDEPVNHVYTKAGTHTVTLTAIQTGQPPKSATSTLTIIVRPGSLSRVNVNPESAKLDIGLSQKFSASASDAYGNPIPEAQITWDTAVGTIAEGLFVAGTKAGTFDKGLVATAKVGSPSANAFVLLSINPDPLKKVMVPMNQIVAGQTKQLEAIATDQYGNKITELEEVWAILDENLGAATKTGLLTAGEVTGTFNGSVEVQVKQGGSVQTARGSVDITPGLLEQMVIAPNPSRIGIEMTQQFVAVGADQYGNRIPGLKFEWSAEKGGSIDKNGLFTAGSEPGTYKNSVKVEVKQEEKIVSSMATVTVEPDRIAFISNRNDKQKDVYIMDVNGGNVERLTNTKATEYQLSASPDGRRILFDSYVVSGGLMVMNDDGSWLFRVASNSSEVVYVDPVWSPDGSKIAFTKVYLSEGKVKDSAIFVMDADGGNSKELFYFAGSITHSPAWSPDGKQLLFWGNGQFGTRPMGVSIPVINADGSNPRILAYMRGTIGNPQWSPDGKKIVFQSYSQGPNNTLQYEIFVMNENGSDIKRLTDNMVDDIQPSWSVDGTKIIFASERGRSGKSQIYIMDADGSNVKRLTENEAEDMRPRWVSRKTGVKVTADSVIIPGSSALKKSLTTQELVTQAKKASVRIKTDLGSGSGFLVDPNGLILTNNHVVVDAKQITVYFEDGRKYPAGVKFRDPVRDLALIGIDAGSLPFLELGDVSQIALGQQVVALGYPLGLDSVSVTSGLVSSIRFDSGRNITWVQTDSAINSGNSGGPLLDLRGRVIGIISMKTTGVGIEGLGFAVSANTVKMYIPQLKVR